MISIIIPAYNEEESIVALLVEIRRIMRVPYEVIVVDDGSTDDTGGVAQKAGASVVSTTHSGVGRAIIEGATHATGDVIITMDADLQCHPGDIPALVRGLGKVDMVIGWRRERNDPNGKLLQSSWYNKVMRFVFKMPLHDFNCPMKAYRRGVIGRLDLGGGMHRFAAVQAYLSGFDVGEITVRSRPRIHGKSHFGYRRIFPFGLCMLRMLAWKPHI